MRGKKGELLWMASEIDNCFVGEKSIAGREESGY